jgi:hypothetical protein
VTPSGETGDTLTLTASPSGLPQNQSHIAVVTVSSTDSTIERSETVRVGLWVSATDPSDELTVVNEQYMQGLAVNPVEPLAYSIGFGDRIYVHNVYTGALVNTLLPQGLNESTAIGVSEDGRLLFVTDFDDGDTFVLDAKAQSAAVLATYPGPFGSNSAPSYSFVSTRVNGHAIIWTPFSEVYDTETHAKVQLRLNGIDFGPSYSGNPAVTPDGTQMIDVRGGLPLRISVRTQRFSMVNGAALHISDTYSTQTQISDPQSLGADAAISANGLRLFTDIGSAGPSASKVLQIGPGQLTFLPDIVLSNMSYPEAIEATWDGRILFGLSFFGNEAQSNLLAFDSDGNSLGASMSGPNNGGRHRGSLGVSGDLFRVVSSHAVPNGLNAPISWAVSFYDLP